MRGKIIAVIGPTRTGKSYLTQKLATHYQTRAFLEGEDADFPPAVIEDLQKNIRPLERFLYFRNISVANHLVALRVAEHERVVFLDTYWFNNVPYISMYNTNELERVLLTQLTDTDAKALPWPDLTLCLSADAAASARLSEASGRAFETADGYLEKQVAAMKKAFDDYFASHEAPESFIMIDRSHLDFDNPADFKTITDRIDKIV